MVKGILHGFAPACIAFALFTGCAQLPAQDESTSGTVPQAPAGQNAAAKPELKMIVEMADGSRIVGSPAGTELSLTSKDGTFKIPLNAVKDVAFESTPGNVVVSFFNGDRLSGVIEQNSFNVETVWGKISLPLQQVRTLIVKVIGNKNKWSLRDGFSTSDDPNGAWSFGWTMEPGALNLYREKFHEGDIHGWRLGGWIPGIWINEGDHEMYGVKPGEVSMHPGSKGEEAIARWQAEKSCTVVVKGSFGAGDSGAVNVRIRQNTKVLFEALNTNKDEPFSLEIDVKEGDFVDFVVAAGRNGISCCNTPIDAVISAK